MNQESNQEPPVVTNGFIQVGDLTPIEYENLTERDQPPKKVYLFKNYGSDYTPKQVPVRIRESKFRQGPCAVCGQKNVKSGRERGVYLCFRCEVAVELVKRGVEAS